MKAHGIDIWIEIEEKDEVIEERLPEFGHTPPDSTKIAQCYLPIRDGKCFNVWVDATEAFSVLPTYTDVRAFGLFVYVDGEYACAGHVRRDFAKVVFYGADTANGDQYRQFRFIENWERPKNYRRKLRDEFDAISVVVIRYRTILHGIFDEERRFSPISVPKKSVLGYGDVRTYDRGITDVSHYEDPIDDIEHSPYVILQMSFRKFGWMRYSTQCTSVEYYRNATKPLKRCDTKKQVSKLLDLDTKYVHKANEARSRPEDALSMLRQVAPNGALDRYAHIAEVTGFRPDYLLELPPHLLLYFLDHDISMIERHTEIVMKWVELQRSLLAAAV